MWQLKSLEIQNIKSFKGKTTFVMRQGKATIVIGDNQDKDEGQLRNGAGKTALIEGIAVGFSGSPISSIKIKELITNDCDFGDISLNFFNTYDNSKLKIYRKIYGNTKSAEYSASINGEDQGALYSDLNMFNAWVWNTIGVSKEDFFAFYLVTLDYGYEPFLRTGDVKKKEIINRFSGADKVDIALPDIQKDSDAKQTDINLAEKELLVNTTQQELLVGQLTEEEKKISEEARNEFISEKEDELAILINDQNTPSQDVVDTFKEAVTVASQHVTDHESGVEEKLQPFKDEVELAELEVDAFEYTEKFDDLLQDIGVRASTLDMAIKTATGKLTLVKDQFKTDIQDITNDELSLKDDISNNEGILLDYETFESEVSKQLLDSIECPKCKHVFNLQDKEFNAEEAKAALPGVKEDIKKQKELITELKEKLNTGIQTRKNDINQKIIAAGETIKTEIATLNQQVVKLGEEKAEINKRYQEEKNAKQLLVNNVTTTKNLLNQETEKQNNALQQLKNNVRRCELNLKQKEGELSAHMQSVAALQMLITTLKAQEVDKSKVEELEGKIGLLMVAEEEINNKLERLRKEKENIDAWEINFKNFKSHLANKSIKNIQDYTNLFLQGMGTNLEIEIDGYKTLASKKIKEQITTTVKRGGFDAGSYGKFSGGERGRIDISTILAMQELIAINVEPGKGLDLLICDEILDQVDTLGLELIVNSLQSLGKTIMIVSQNEVNAIAEHTITIQKLNKVSTILKIAA